MLFAAFVSGATKPSKSDGMSTRVGGVSPHEPIQCSNSRFVTWYTVIAIVRISHKQWLKTITALCLPWVRISSASLLSAPSLDLACSRPSPYMNILIISRRVPVSLNGTGAESIISRKDYFFSVIQNVFRSSPQLRMNASHVRVRSRSPP